MNWQPVTVPLSSLTPWERNPKRISKSHARRLLELWERLGQFQTVAIGPAGEVYDGHQRLSVLKAAFGGAYEVKALRAERALSEDERAELVISAHSGTVGTWDWDALAGWDAGQLQGWGFDAETLAALNFDAMNLREMLNAGGNDEDGLWEGMPEFEQPDKMAFRTIIMHFNDQQAVDDFAVLVGQGITDKTRYLYYPKQERENLKAYSVQDES